MKDKNNFFYQLIDRLDMNFYWVGNSFIPCDGEFDGECFYNYKNKNVLFTKMIINSFNLYEHSIFSYFFHYYINQNFISGYNFLTKKKNINYKISSNIFDFFLIHAAKPHTPYTLNSNCNETIKVKPFAIDGIVDPFPNISEIDHKKLYGYQYKCAFRAALEWSNYFIDKEEDNIILIMGDHSWIFDYRKKTINKFKDKLDEVFFAYKVPSRCNSIDTPNTHVNVLRFILQCITDKKISYLEDRQYITREFRDKLHPDYGKVVELSDALNSLKE